MSDVTTDPTSSKKTGSESAGQTAASEAHCDSGAKPAQSPDSIVYPSLEMADPVIRFYNPFKK